METFYTDLIEYWLKARFEWVAIEQCSVIQKARMQQYLFKAYSYFMLYFFSFLFYVWTQMAGFVESQAFQINIFHTIMPWNLSTLEWWKKAYSVLCKESTQLMDKAKEPENYGFHKCLFFNMPGNSSAYDNSWNSHC